MSIRYALNRMPHTADTYLPLMSESNVALARRFHSAFPEYAVTPLTPLPGMAAELGLGALYVKDESYRFGLNAFKVLGGSFAMARAVADELGRPAENVDYAYLTGEDFRREYGQATFFTATDGNHGRGVAWAARRLGQRAVVRMPAGTAESRYQNIRALGAEVTIEPCNYDDCVRLAARQAAETTHGVIIQDTAWPGYEAIPGYIMQGYGTLMSEALEQLATDGTDRPTHVFAQAGVGSLAGAAAGYLANRYPENPPRVIVVEADAADCLTRSALADDLRTVGGALRTVMAGLACGEPNPIGWDILRNHASAFVSCPDTVSARGMRMLAAPVRGDAPVISGESGAVGMGLLWRLMRDPACTALRDALALGADSRVLLLSTEGDTDPVNYRRVVWGGAYPDAIEEA